MKTEIKLKAKGSEMIDIEWLALDADGNTHYFHGDTIRVFYDHHNDRTRVEFLSMGEMTSYIPLKLLDKIEPRYKSEESRQI